MELFIKRFIDLLDELFPVTMVHTLLEQPLGAITHDFFVKIHARLDMADENSPFVEMEIYPYEQNKIDLLFAYTYPKNGISREDEFVKKLKVKKVRTEKVIPINEDEDFYYEVFYDYVLTVPGNSSEIDQVISSKVLEIKDWLTISGYREVSV